MKPLLNSGRVQWVDVPKVEQEMLGLLWRGNKITHPGGEHDDFANSVAGVVQVLHRQARATTQSAQTEAEEESERPETELDAYLGGYELKPGTQTARMRKWIGSVYTKQLPAREAAAKLAEIDAVIASAPHDQVFRNLREQCFYLLDVTRLLNSGQWTNMEATELLDRTLDRFEDEQVEDE